MYTSIPKSYILALPSTLFEERLLRVEVVSVGFESMVEGLVATFVPCIFHTFPISNEFPPLHAALSSMAGKDWVDANNNQVCTCAGQLFGVFCGSDKIWRVLCETLNSDNQPQADFQH